MNPTYLLKGRKMMEPFNTIYAVGVTVKVTKNVMRTHWKARKGQKFGTRLENTLTAGNAELQAFIRTAKDIKDI